MSVASNREKQATTAADNEALEHERTELLQRLEDWLETPMLVLAFAWLALLIVELVWGESAWFEIIGTIIWIVFILNFVVEFVLAPADRFRGTTFMVLLLGKGLSKLTLPDGRTDLLNAATLS